MALTGADRILNGVVRLMRSSTSLRTTLKGGIHEDVAGRRVKYPLATYGKVSAPYVHDWGSNGNAGVREIHALVDISFWSLSKVEAENLDQLTDNLFSSSTSTEDLDAVVVGQTVFYCRRVGDLPMGPARDNEGRRIVRDGGTYDIRTYQPIPLS